MHEMPAACLVQFAVNRDSGQEGILGIERPVNDQTQLEITLNNIVSLERFNIKSQSYILNSIQNIL